MPVESSMDALYIKDDEYAGNSAKYREYAENLQIQWDAFINASLKISTESIIQGGRADVYLSFIRLARDYMKSKLKDIASLTSTDMDLYIEAIDVADDIIY